MILKEAFETTNEAEKEAQKTITFIKQHSYNSSKHLHDSKYIGTFKEECLIGNELRWLANFLNRILPETKKEIEDYKFNVNKACLRIKCEQMDSIFQSENFLSENADDNEDYGEE